MKVSYIILTWNSEKYIKKCIDSILSIKDIEHDIIVVDNGSNDNTKIILKEYKTLIRTIYLDKNYGTTKSRNLGIKESDEDSDYICILDSDTQINKLALEKLISLAQEEKVGIVGPQMITSSGVVQKSGRR